MATNREKGRIGLLALGFAPIATEPVDAHPTYGDDIDLGSVAAADVSVTANQLRVYGDNALKISADIFDSATVDAETLLDDMEVQSALFGSTKLADGSYIDRDTDAAANGLLHFIRELMLADKTHVYRAVCFYKSTANLSAFKESNKTRGGQLEFGNSTIQFTCGADNSGAWRRASEFETLAAAKEWVSSVIAGTAKDDPAAG